MPDKQPPAANSTYTRLGQSGTGTGTTSDPYRTLAELNAGYSAGDTNYIATAGTGAYAMDAHLGNAGSSATSHTQHIGVADWDSDGMLTLPKDETEFPVLAGSTTSRTIGATGEGQIVQNLKLTSSTAASNYGWAITSDRTICLNCVFEYTGTYRAISMNDAALVNCKVVVTNSTTSAQIVPGGRDVLIGCYFDVSSVSPSGTHYVVDTNGTAGEPFYVLDCAFSLGSSANVRGIDVDGFDNTAQPCVIDHCAFVGGGVGVNVSDAPDAADPAPVIICNSLFSGQSDTPINNFDVATVSSTVVTFNNVYGAGYTGTNDALAGLQEWNALNVGDIAFNNPDINDYRMRCRVPGMFSRTNPFTTIRAVERHCRPHATFGPLHDEIGDTRTTGSM